MAMTVIQNIVIFIGACITLALAGSFLVKSLEKISHYLRLGEFAISFIIVSVATSIPELFVGISSAIGGDASLSLGNIIGANIIDVTLVVGVAVLLVGALKIHTNAHTRKDLLYVLGIVALPLILMLDKKLGRIDGLILTALFFVYMYKIYLDGKYHIRPKQAITKKKFWSAAFILVLSLSALLYSAHIIVKSSSELSILFALPAILLGLFMISFGTTLPELIFTFEAAKMKHGNMITGNAIGSIVTNSTIVLGIAAMIRPIVTNFTVFLVSGIFMLFATGLFLAIVERGKKLTRLEGMALIGLYSLFVFLTLILL